MMYFFDTRKHKTPHIHVKFQEYEAVYKIPDGVLLEGFIPKNKTKLIEAWIELHSEELVANWRLAIEGLPLFKIEPLK